VENRFGSVAVLLMEPADDVGAPIADGAAYAETVGTLAVVTPVPKGRDGRADEGSDFLDGHEFVGGVGIDRCGHDVAFHARDGCASLKPGSLVRGSPSGTFQKFARLTPCRSCSACGGRSAITTSGAVMSDLKDTRGALRSAIEHVEALRSAVRRRQEDLLELETVTDRVTAGKVPGLTLVDQAEDLRRGVDIIRTVDLPPVRSALLESQNQLVEAGVSGRIDSGHAWTHAYASVLSLMVVRRAELDLADASRALAPIAHAGAEEPGLPLRSRAHLAECCRRLEMVDRAGFRIAKELPHIHKAIEELPQPDTSQSVPQRPYEAPVAEAAVPVEELMFPPSITARPGRSAPEF